MISKKVTVSNQQGFHMRPANMFVSAMAPFKSEVSIIYNGNTINGKSPMFIIAACIRCGSEIEIKCNGEDEEEALSVAVDLVESGFGE